MKKKAESEPKQKKLKQNKKVSKFPSFLLSQEASPPRILADETTSSLESLKLLASPFAFYFLW